jgi:hypothetical protein
MLEKNMKKESLMAHQTNGRKKSFDNLPDFTSK